MAPAGPWITPDITSQTQSTITSSPPWLPGKAQTQRRKEKELLRKEGRTEGNERWKEGEQSPGHQNEDRKNVGEQWKQKRWWKRKTQNQRKQRRMKEAEKKKNERGKVERGRVDDLEQTFISCQLVLCCVYVCVVWLNSFRTIASVLVCVFGGCVCE